MPILYLAQSSVQQQAHAKLAPGMEMLNPTGKRKSTKRNIGYVDDNKGMVSSNLVGEEAEQEVANNLQESGQIWSK